MGWPTPVHCRALCGTFYLRRVKRAGSPSTSATRLYRIPRPIASCGRKVPLLDGALATCFQIFLRHKTHLKGSFPPSVRFIPQRGPVPAETPPPRRRAPDAVPLHCTPLRNKSHTGGKTALEVSFMPKQGMARPERTHTQPRNEVPPVPELQGT